MRGEPYLLAFVDIVSAEFYIPNYDSWAVRLYKKAGIEFCWHKGHVTDGYVFDYVTNGKLAYTDTRYWEGWELRLSVVVDKLTGEITFKLKVTGNPSGIYHGKNRNYRNIPYVDFLNILSGLAETLGTGLEEMLITTPTEASLTISIAGIILGENIHDRFMRYKRQPFTAMELNNGKPFGYRSNNTNMDLKIYLTSMKFRENLRELRIETHYHHIDSFTKATDIRTLADFVDGSKMIKCLEVVQKAWNGTIIYDPLLTPNMYYPPYINAMIVEGAHPDYWNDGFILSCSDKTRANRITKYRNLCFQNGEGIHVKIATKMADFIDKFRKTATCLVGISTEYIEEPYHVRPTNRLKIITMGDKAGIYIARLKVIKMIARLKMIGKERKCKEVTLPTKPEMRRAA